MAGKANNKPHNPRRKNPTILERINPNAAGIDCGSAEHYVAVPSDRDPSPVRAFKTFTADLTRLADWLVACGINTVAMEATGVYWIPLYDILEARGLEVVLVNARHVKNVPGRKSDVRDCEWLQQLHSVGLLRGSFRPVAEITTLRSYMRHRDSLVRGVVNTVNRMEKALVLMNLQLHLVVTDLVGATGLRIIRDLVAGKTDPRRLAIHRDVRCKASEAEIEAALTGNCRPEHLFVLRQNLELYDTYQLKICDCDAEIEGCLRQLAGQKEPPENPLPPKRAGTRAPKGNEPRFDIRGPLYQLLGTDLTQINGIGAHNALRLITEIGTDMSRWPTERHFTSWMTLAPRNRITGGRLLGTARLACANRAATMLRMSAVSVGRTQTALGAFYRRLSLRSEKAIAITATARKLAILVYRTLKGEITYKDPGVSAYDIRYRASAVKRLRQRAEALGLTLIDQTTGEVFGEGVS